MAELKVIFSARCDKDAGFHSTATAVLRTATLSHCSKQQIAVHKGQQNR
jgi:hypothetical protein